MARPSSATCPHCFETFSLRTAVFRCQSDHCTARNAGEAVIDGSPLKFERGHALSRRADAVMTSAWEDNRLFSHSFTVPGLEGLPLFGKPRTRATCPLSEERTTEKLCPACHKQLYPLIGHGSDLRMTLIGGANAGKSNYIAVLIDELRRAKGERFGFSVRPLDVETGPRYTDNYFRPVFEHRRLVDGTAIVTKRSAVVAPLVFGLQFAADSARPMVTLSLFDPPGEGVINDSHVEKFHQFVFNSAGLVLLVDAEKLMASGRFGDHLSEANRALEVAIRQLEAQHAGRPKSMPYVAIAVSKADLLRPGGELPERFWQEPQHVGGYDDVDFQLVGNEVERLLRSRGGATLCNIAENMFGRDHVGYFAFSALGQAPVGTALSSEIVPLRVAEPFIWLLSRHGVVPRRGSP
uniref:TRAFAC clade GTPase domain-containing protein n=1 Tax=unclassified Variovorax TaxID=663243 RepID=UPI000D3A24E4